MSGFWLATRDPDIRGGRQRRREVSFDLLSGVREERHCWGGRQGPRTSAQGGSTQLARALACHRMLASTRHRTASGVSTKIGGRRALTNAAVGVIGTQAEAVAHMSAS